MAPSVADGMDCEGTMSEDAAAMNMPEVRLATALGVRVGIAESLGNAGDSALTGRTRPVKNRKDENVIPVMGRQVYIKARMVGSVVPMEIMYVIIGREQG